MIIVGALLALLPVALGVYAYLVYPAVLRVLARRASGRPSTARSWPPESLPVVTIVVPAYNEAHQIGQTLEALINQDYPADRRQILVLSDASTDGTDGIVRSFAARGVELLRMPARAGKTAAENASLPHIRGSIIVNTDASVRLHPSATRLLVQAMADPSVGVASTRDISVDSHGAASENAAEGTYVGYEMRIRALETETGGIVGASGSGYAIRATLHAVQVRNDLSRDFSSALTAQRHGYRAVSVDGAICYVPRSLSLYSEYRRKVRTISRGMGTLYHNRDLLNPLEHGLFAWKLMSHKVVRWLVPVSALPALGGVALLASARPVAAWIFVVAALGAVLAALGALWPERRPVPRWLPSRVLGMLAANLAVVHSVWRFLHQHQDHVWEPTRRAATSA